MNEMELIAASLGFLIGCAATSAVWYSKLHWWRSTPEWRIYEHGFVAGRKVGQRDPKEPRP